MACTRKVRRSQSDADATSTEPPRKRAWLPRVVRRALIRAIAASAITAIVRRVIARRRGASDDVALRPVARTVGAAQWPPLVDADAPDTPGWVEPVDGACPLSHPVKGNASSQIYHVPGSRFYDMTSPERCYRDAAAAEADGMRAPKR